MGRNLGGNSGGVKGFSPFGRDGDGAAHLEEAVRVGQGCKGSLMEFGEAYLYAEDRVTMSHAMSRRLLHWTSRQAWFGLGFLALVLGFIGIFLPLLPTTPLVILAAFAFSKSSPRFERWLLGHRIFGPIIADWRANRAIAPRYKAISVSMMGAAFCLSLALELPAVVLAVQGIVLGLAATFILTRPSRPGTGG